MSFAKGTDVPIDRSRCEIERILDKYGASGFFYSSEGNQSIVGFKSAGRIVKIVMPAPGREEFAVDGRHHVRSEPELMVVLEKESRRRWRCLVLAIKAKLEIVESGITSFEQEFLSHIMIANGRTVGEEIAPQIEQSYNTGKGIPLMLTQGGF